MSNEEFKNYMQQNITDNGNLTTMHYPHKIYDAPLNNIKSIDIYQKIFYIPKGYSVLKNMDSIVDTIDDYYIFPNKFISNGKIKESLINYYVNSFN